MADLAKIQFKRTSTSGKAPTTSQISAGELAINTADSALYTSDGTKIIQLSGDGIPSINSKYLKVDGSSNFNGDVTIAETGTLYFKNNDLSGAVTKHISGVCGTNDGWYIGSGADGTNKGFVEIGTTDDGDEEIRFVKRGSGGTIKQQVKILNTDGNTELPGDLTVGRVKSGDRANFGSGTNDIFINNSKSNKFLQLKDDGSLQYDSKPIYWDGRKPTLSELGIDQVINVRQGQENTWPTNMAGGISNWVKIAKITNPGSSGSKLQLMISGAADFGGQECPIIWVDASGRGLPTTLTTSNIYQWLKVRFMGGGIDTSARGNAAFGYVSVDSGKAAELWMRTPSYSGSGIRVSLLSKEGSVEYYLPTGYQVLANNDGPAGIVLATNARVFDTFKKPDINNDTTGILALTNGGTGANTKEGARQNLGLGTASIRDVGLGSGQLMEVGAYGWGGNGDTFKYTSAKDLFNALKGTGGRIFRNDGTAGGLSNFGPNLFMKTGDTYANINVEYNSGIIRVIAGNNNDINNNTLRTNILYGTANKPSPDDVNAVAKSGDTMTGNLIINKSTPSMYLNSTDSGNTHLWFQGQGIERGVIWAVASTGSFGQINIRAKTTAGVSAGDFNFNSNGEFKAPSHVRAGDAIFRTDGNITGGTNFNGNLASYLGTEFGKQVSKSGDIMTGNLVVSNQSKPNAIDIGSNTNGNWVRLTVSRNISNTKLTSALVISTAGRSRWAHMSSPDDDTNNAPNTIEMDNKITYFKGAIQGDDAPIALQDGKSDLNDLIVSGLYSDSPGSKRTYICSSTGGGTNISNKPSGVQGNFYLEVIGARRVSGTDCNGFQQLYSGDTKKVFRRYYLKSSNAATSWTAWTEVMTAEGGTFTGNIDITTPSSADALLTLNGKSGARGNSLGDLVLFAGTSRSIHFRPNGDNSSSANNMILDPNGLLSVKTVTVAGDIINTADNSIIRAGNNGDIGLVKKNGSSGRILVGATNGFIVAKSNKTSAISAADTQTTIFSVDSNGVANMNAGVAGDFTVNGTLYVSTVNSGIYFPKTNTNPRNSRLYGAGDNTRGNRIEIADDTGWLQYIERHPAEGVQLQVNGRVVAGDVYGNNFTAGGTISATSSIYTNADLHAGGNVYASGAYLTTDGNVWGGKWGGWISDWIGNNFVWKGDDYRNWFTNCINEGRADGRIQYWIQAQGPGEVGTYAMLQNVTSRDIYPGNIVGGGDLRWSAAGDWQTNTSPPGNWRCMGAIRTNGGGDGDQTTIFLRIA